MNNKKDILKIDLTTYLYFLIIILFINDFDVLANIMILSYLLSLLFNYLMGVFSHEK